MTEQELLSANIVKYIIGFNVLWQLSIYYIYIEFQYLAVKPGVLHAELEFLLENLHFCYPID